MYTVERRPGLLGANDSQRLPRFFVRSGQSIIKNNKNGLGFFTCLSLTEFARLDSFCTSLCTELRGAVGTPVATWRHASKHDVVRDKYHKFMTIKRTALLTRGRAPRSCPLRCAAPSPFATSSVCAQSCRYSQFVLIATHTPSAQTCECWPSWYVKENAGTRTTAQCLARRASVCRRTDDAGRSERGDGA